MQKKFGAFIFISLFFSQQRALLFRSSNFSSQQVEFLSMWFSVFKRFLCETKQKPFVSVIRIKHINKWHFDEDILKLFSWSEKSLRIRRNKVVRLLRNYLKVETKDQLVLMHLNIPVSHYIKNAHYFLCKFSNFVETSILANSAAITILFVSAPG